MMLSGPLGALRPWVWPPEAASVSAEQRRELYNKLYAWNDQRQREGDLYAAYHALSDAAKRSDAGSRFAAALSRLRQADNAILSLVQPVVKTAQQRGYLDGDRRPLVELPSSFEYQAPPQMAGLGLLPLAGAVLIVASLCAAVIFVSLNGPLIAWARAWDTASKAMVDALEVERQIQLQSQQHDQYLVSQGLKPQGYKPDPRGTLQTIFEEGTNITGLVVLGIGLFAAMKIFGRRA